MRFRNYILALCLVATATAPASAFCFDEAAQRYGVSPVVLWAIAKQESNFNPAAVNRSNKNGSIDVGLMQINSLWSKQLGETWDALFDPCTNVMTGAWILRQCVNQYGNTWEAVGCYNSRTPSIRNAYASRIAKILEKSQGMTAKKPTIQVQDATDQLLISSAL